MQLYLTVGPYVLGLAFLLRVHFDFNTHHIKKLRLGNLPTPAERNRQQDEERKREEERQKEEERKRREFQQARETARRDLDRMNEEFRSRRGGSGGCWKNYRDL